PAADRQRFRGRSGRGHSRHLPRPGDRRPGRPVRRRARGKSRSERLNTSLACTNTDRKDPAVRTVRGPRRLLTIIATIVALAVLAAGCGESGGGETSATPQGGDTPKKAI